jgi:hypothetical protein
VEIRRRKLRRKEDRKLKTAATVIPLTKKNKTFSALGWGLFPWPVLGLFFMSRDVLGAFSATSRASLGLAQSNYFAARRFLGSSGFW